MIYERSVMKELSQVVCTLSTNTLIQKGFFEK